VWIPNQFWQQSTKVTFESFDFGNWTCLRPALVHIRTEHTNASKIAHVLVKTYKFVIFQVLTSATTKMNVKFRVFWDEASCSHVEVDRRFRRTYCLHHQSYWW
jgi:hypothetical protein